MPWIPAGSPLRTALAAGSTATTRTSGRSRLRTRPTPVMVPPVPTPATNATRSSPTASRISRAVVRSCDAGLAAFSNCRGMKAPRRLRAICSARATAPAIPCSAGREDDLGAVRAEDVAALEAHVLRHHEDAAIAAHRGDHGERDARVAARRLDDDGAVRPISPAASAAATIASAGRSLTLPPGFLTSSLPTTAAPPARSDARQADERRAPDQVEDAVGDCRPSRPRRSLRRRPRRQPARAPIATTSHQKTRWSTLIVSPA